MVLATHAILSLLAQGVAFVPARISPHAATDQLPGGSYIALTRHYNPMMNLARLNMSIVTAIDGAAAGGWLLHWTMR